MFKVARLLPRDVEVEIFEDPRLPGLTFMEVRLMASHPQSQAPFRVVPPGRAVG